MSLKLRIRIGFPAQFLSMLMLVHNFESEKYLRKLILTVLLHSIVFIFSYRGDYNLFNYDTKGISKVTPGDFDYTCKNLNRIVFLSDLEIAEALTQNYNERLLTSFIFNIASHKKILFNLLYQTILFNKTEAVNSLSTSIDMAVFIHTIHPLFFVKGIKEIVSNYNVFPMGGCFNAIGHDMIKIYNPDTEGYLHFLKSSPKSDL